MPRKRKSAAEVANPVKTRTPRVRLQEEAARLGSVLDALEHDSTRELEPELVEPEMETATTADIPLRLIDLRGSNVRSTMGPQELQELVQSIRRFGVLEPVLVQDLGKTRGYRYRLIAGFRRSTAARLAGLTAIPARIIGNTLSETEIKHIQLTENIQREAMRVRDIVGTIHSLREDGATQREIAEQLGISPAKVSVYFRLGELIARNRTLAQYVDQGLVGPSHFIAAMELIVKVRRRAGELTDDPAQIEAMTQKAEGLFTQMLDRLASQKRLTARAVAAEVARLLTMAGIESNAAGAKPSKPRSLPAHAVLANVERMDLDRLVPSDLEQFVKVVEPRLKTAKARLKSLAKRAE
ncbi:MAG: ParB/RepB/Spo0J family partition protein [Thermaerobacter sp.]|nr:ParB/RepB/Spo0J family partition protein [Thermaerobacter sp.]